MSYIYMDNWAEDKKHFNMSLKYGPYLGYSEFEELKKQFNSPDPVGQLIVDIRDCEKELSDNQVRISSRAKRLLRNLSNC